MPNNITISGPKNPPIGRVGAYYSINLPKPKDSNMTYRWFIYRPGSEKTLIPGSNKEGIKVNFSFDDQWKNKTYLIKVFECLKGKTYKELFEAGKLKKELASFEITPKEAVNTKILNPEILKVDHRKMGDGDPNKVSYQDTLLVWAETQGLQNKEITFKLLWNNDKEPKKVFKAKVDNKGRAEVKIPLATHPDVLDAYVKNKTSKDKSTEHTFKVEASFGEPPKTNGKKATQVKGKIKDVYFIDKNNKKVTKLKKGDVVRVRIESEGMINKSFQYFILEKDKYTPDDAITSSGVLTFKDDIFIGREIEIDDEKLLWGGKEREGEDRKEQNYTIEVKTFSDSKGSKPFQITTEDLKVEYGISAVKVTIGEVNKNTKTLPANSLFLPDIQIREVYEVKDDKNVSLEPDKEADKHIKVLDEKTSVATEYKEKDIATVKQTSSMIIRFSVTPKGGKKVGYLGVFLTTIPEAENLYGYELYYNYKNVLSPNIASITIKEGEKERPFGSGYTTKINGKETEFELKIVFNEDKKINSDVFIDIFSNTNAALAKPTLSGVALHRFKMKIVNKYERELGGWPVEAYYKKESWKRFIASGVGKRNLELKTASKNHQGIDINFSGGGNTDIGAPVYATHDGIVHTAKETTSGTGGRYINILSHNKKIMTRYLHLSKLFVKKGDIVKKGQKTGEIGASYLGKDNEESAISAHLHYEIRKVDDKLNPTEAIDPTEGRGIKTKELLDPQKLINTLILLLLFFLYSCKENRSHNSLQNMTCTEENKNNIEANSQNTDKDDFYLFFNKRS
mgnify:CR=1 FL=1